MAAVSHAWLLVRKELPTFSMCAAVRLSYECHAWLLYERQCVKPHRLQLLVVVECTIPLVNAALNHFYALSFPIYW
jgi:hypothetical protein